MNQKHMRETSPPGVNSSGPGPQAVLCKRRHEMQRLVTGFQDDAQGAGMSQVETPPSPHPAARPQSAFPRVSKGLTRVTVSHSSSVLILLQ